MSKNPFIITFLISIISYQLVLSGNNANNESAPFKYVEEFKSDLKKKMESTRTPSVSIAVAHNGKIIWEESFGWADREKKIRATPHTTYSLASVTKPMTATAMMVLVERGLIDMEEPVNSYLLNVKLNAFEGDAADATVSRLLHHTAGLPTIWNFYFNGAQTERPNISHSISKYGILTSPPGTLYEYSNLGYGIAEYIIECLSGESYAEFMKTEIFQPLGMDNTFIATERSHYDLIAPRYLENKNISPFYEVMSRGGGGACGSVHDLVHFGMFHLKNHLPDQKQILHDNIIDFMQSNVDPKVPDSPYKIGWNVTEYNGYTIVDHGGGMPGVSSILMLVPAENMAVAVLSNGTYMDLNEIGCVLISLALPRRNDIQKQNINNDKYIQFPSDQYTGMWDGFIETDEYKIPVSLQIQRNGDVNMILDNKKETLEPIEPFFSRYGILNGSFDMQINTKDASVCRHKVKVCLRLNNKKLSGYAAAISYRSEVFYLPYYMMLKRRIH